MPRGGTPLVSPGPCGRAIARKEKSGGICGLLGAIGGQSERDFTFGHFLPSVLLPARLDSRVFTAKIRHGSSSGAVVGDPHLGEKDRRCPGRFFVGLSLGLGCLEACGPGLEEREPCTSRAIFFPFEGSGFCWGWTRRAPSAHLPSPLAVPVKQQGKLGLFP